MIIKSYVTNKPCPLEAVSEGVQWCPNCGRLVIERTLHTPRDTDTSLDCGEDENFPVKTVSNSVDENSEQSFD